MSKHNSFKNGRCGYAKLYQDNLAILKVAYFRIDKEKSKKNNHQNAQKSQPR